MPPPEHTHHLEIVPLPAYHNGDASVHVPRTLIQIMQHRIQAESIALMSEAPHANEIDHDLHTLAIDEELRMIDILQILLDTKRARVDGKSWNDHIEKLSEELEYDTPDTLQKSGQRLLDAMEQIY